MRNERRARGQGSRARSKDDVENPTSLQPTKPHNAPTEPDTRSTPSKSTRSRLHIDDDAQRLFASPPTGARPCKKQDDKGAGALASVPEEAPAKEAPQSESDDVPVAEVVPGSEETEEEGDNKNEETVHKINKAKEKTDDRKDAEEKKTQHDAQEGAGAYQKTTEEETKELTAIEKADAFIEKTKAVFNRADTPAKMRESTSKQLNPAFESFTGSQALDNNQVLRFSYVSAAHIRRDICACDTYYIKYVSQTLISLNEIYAPVTHIRSNIVSDKYFGDQICIHHTYLIFLIYLPATHICCPCLCL